MESKPIRLSEERYRQIFENSAVAITVADASEKIISWNKLAEDVLGMNREDLYLREVASLYPPEEWKKIRSYNLRKTGMQHRLESRMIKKGGRIIDVDVSISILKDKEGVLTGSIGMISDISERKWVERELRATDQKYESIFENSAVAIMVTDAQEKITSWNRFTEDLLHRSREDLHLKPMSSCFPSEEWKKIQALSLSDKGRHHHFETQALRGDKGEVDINISITVLKDMDNKVQGAIAVMVDISEKKRFEQIKDDFVSTVSHELRTPLFVVQEGIAQVHDGILGDINEEQKEFLSDTLKSIDRLSRIIDDLLDVSKIEAKRMDLRKEQIDILAVVHEVANSFQAHAANKMVEICQEFSHEKINVYLDRDRMIQVFTNLVGNAFKFTEKGAITISVEDKGDEVQCSVRDSGCGIAEENLPSVFNKFHQFGKKATSGGKGTGLGLSICKGIVELHGGRIWVESQLDVGTSFVFIIPKGSVKQLFVEYVAKDIEVAARLGSGLTVGVFSLLHWGAICKQWGRDNLNAMGSDMAAKIKIALRNPSDVAMYMEGQVMVLVSVNDRSAVQSIFSRLQKVMDDALSSQKEIQNIEYKLVIHTYPEDGEDQEAMLKKLGLIP